VPVIAIVSDSFPTLMGALQTRQAVAQAELMSAEQIVLAHLPPCHRVAVRLPRTDASDCAMIGSGERRWHFGQVQMVVRGLQRTSRQGSQLGGACRAFATRASPYCTNRSYRVPTMRNKDDSILKKPGPRCTTQTIAETESCGDERADLQNCGIKQSMPESRILEYHSQPSRVNQQFVHRDVRS
jgi:hypothetical protein